MRSLHVDTGREMRGGQWQAIYLVGRLPGATLLARAGSPLLEEARKRKLDVRPLTIRAFRAAAKETPLIHAHDARAHTLAATTRAAPLVVSRRVAFPLKRGVLSAWKYAQAAMYLAVSRFVAAELAAAGIAEHKIRVVHDGVPIPEAGNPQPGRVVAPASKPVQIPGVSVDLSTDLWQDLETASVFVYKSDLEGLGSAALAAMAAGVPVVASGVGGLPEVVPHGQTGFVVQVGGFQTPVRHLLDDPPLAAAMGAAGRARVEREFSVERMVTNTIAAYREVLGC